MIRGKLAPITESAVDSTVAAMFIGGLVGGVVGGVAMLTCRGTTDEIIHALSTNVIGMAVMVVLAILVGAGLGVVVGAGEGAIAYAFADWCAHRRHSVRTLGWVLGTTLVLLNLSIAALMCQLVLGAQGDSIAELDAPLLCGAATTVAVLAYAWIHAVDWPDLAAAASASTAGEGDGSTEGRGAAGSQATVVGPQDEVPTAEVPVIDLNGPSRLRPLRRTER